MCNINIRQKVNIETSTAILLILSVAWLPVTWSADTDSTSCDEISIFNAAQSCVTPYLAGLLQGNNLLPLGSNTRTSDTKRPKVCREVKTTSECLETKLQSCDIKADNITIFKEKLLPYLSALEAMCIGSNCPSESEVRSCLQLLPVVHATASNLSSGEICPKLNDADACLKLKRCRYDEVPQISNIVDSWNKENDASNDAYFLCSNGSTTPAGISMGDGSIPARYCEANLIDEVQCSFSYIWEEGRDGIEGSKMFSCGSGNCEGSSGGSTCPSETELRKCLRLLPLTTADASSLTYQQFCPILRIASDCLDLTSRCSVDEVSEIANIVYTWNIEKDISNNVAYFFCSNDGQPPSGEKASGLTIGNKTIVQTIGWYCETREIPEVGCSLSYIWNAQHEDDPHGPSSTSRCKSCGTDRPVNCDDSTIFNYTSASCDSCPDRYLPKDGNQCVLDNSVGDGGSDGAVSVQVTSVLMMTSVIYTVMFML